MLVFEIGDDMPNIKLKDVSKYFGRVKALAHVDLEIHEGEYMVLLGPSGCGKTTLLKIIAGILKPSTGSVSIAGKDVTSLPPEDRDIGFLFQNYALFPHMSALDNAAYGPIARGENTDKARRKAAEMLELVHLKGREGALPRELSGGMQQRLAMARALTTGSKLMFLDEPTNALDAHIRAELRVELRRLAKKLKLTVIHVTHDQEEAMALADKIVIMKNGGVLQTGAPYDVYHKPSSPFVASFLGEANFLRVKFTTGRANILGQKIRAKLNGEYIAVIRPENLRFGHKGAKVEITNSRSFGPFYKYDVDCDGVRLQVRTTHRYEHTDRLTFNPKNVLFFKEPEEGLEKSLGIE
jgi:ABC-type Fe3+/spermidine/putrescine transport system ATPase subunit